MNHLFHSLHDNQSRNLWALSQMHQDQILSLDFRNALPIVPRSASDLVMSDGIAVIAVQGVMLKQRIAGANTTSTVELTMEIQAAMNSPNVKGVFLLLNSPGGLAQGNLPLAQAIKSLAAAKPVMGFAEGVCASACYFIGSQVPRLLASADAYVGSIGTYMVLPDFSGYFSEAGVKIHVIKAGDLKGMGVFGAAVPQEHIDALQRLTNDTNQHFIDAVMGGRKFTSEQMQSVATGDLWIGSRALEHKLVDGISTAETALQEFIQTVSAATKPKGKPMSQDSTTAVAADIKPQAATIGELRQHLPKASSDFILSQVEKGATLTQAALAYASEADTQLAAQSQALATATATAKAAASKPGNVPHGEQKIPGGNASVDPLSAWSEAIAAKQKLGLSQAKATAAVVKEQPELHSAYVAAINSRRAAK